MAIKMHFGTSHIVLWRIIIFLFKFVIAKSENGIAYKLYAIAALVTTFPSFLNAS